MEYCEMWHRRLRVFTNLVESNHVRLMQPHSHRRFACTVKYFPIDPQDFMLLYPDIYDAADPPITSRFSRAKIDEVWTSVPARQNNKLLAAPSDIRIASLPACTMVDDPMRQMIENPMMMTMMPHLIRAHGATVRA